jgi:RNA polymerase sigma-70 factor, ECF subfamily
MHFSPRLRTILDQIEITVDHAGLWLVELTSVSLLDRLKAAPPDAADWQRLQGIYLPLIRRWLRRVPGLGDEADDLGQEVFLVLLRELPRFERRREGSFRAWLRNITVNKARNFGKQRDRRPAVGLDLTDGFLDQMADPDSDLAREWDREHDAHVVQKILTAVQPDFHPATWEAFQRLASDGVPAARVAKELGLTENAVLLAKSRVLRRLREEAGILLQ